MHSIYLLGFADTQHVYQPETVTVNKTPQCTWNKTQNDLPLNILFTRAKVQTGLLRHTQSSFWDRGQNTMRLLKHLNQQSFKVIISKAPYKSEKAASFYSAD